MSHQVMPEAVKKAVFLLYLGLAIGIIGAIWDFPAIKEMASAVEIQPLGTIWFILMFQFIIFSSAALLIWLISKRKNWARWIFVIMTIVGVPMTIEPILNFSNEPVMSMFNLISTVINLMAVILLFLKPSREWFKKPKAI